MNSDDKSTPTVKDVLADLAATVDPDAEPQSDAADTSAVPADNAGTAPASPQGGTRSLPFLNAGAASESVDVLASAPFKLPVERRLSLLALVKEELAARNQTAPTLQQVLVEAMTANEHTFDDVSALIGARSAALADGGTEIDPSLYATKQLRSIEAGATPIDTKDFGLVVALWATVENLPKGRVIDAFRTSVDRLGRRPESAAAGVGRRLETGKSPRPEVEEKVERFVQVFDQVSNG